MNYKHYILILILSAMLAFTLVAFGIGVSKLKAQWESMNTKVDTIYESIEM